MSVASRKVKILKVWHTVPLLLRLLLLLLFLCGRAFVVIALCASLCSSPAFVL